jgi:hypothetical protein
VTIDPLSPGDCVWFVPVSTVATVVERHASGNYRVQWRGARGLWQAVARPYDLEPLMPCGHPVSAVRGEGATHWCSECQKEAEATA